MRKQTIPNKDVIKLKRDIIHHFGSLSAFHRQTKYNYRHLLRVFNDLDYSDSEIDKITNVFTEQKASEPSPLRISNEDRIAIRLNILTNFKFFSTFCKKHQEFDVVYISNITNTDNGLTMRTPKFNKLIKLLSKLYNYKN